MTSVYATDRPAGLAAERRESNDQKFFASLFKNTRLLALSRYTQRGVMTVEIVFPLEFIVEGTPVSFQSKRPASRVVWKDRIRQASRGALPEGHFATRSALAITLFYFPNGEMKGDVDNIVKPILDALCQHIYFDDRQIERIWVQKFEPERRFNFRNPSASLSKALAGPRPRLYIRIVDDPVEGLF